MILRSQPQAEAELLTFLHPLSLLIQLQTPLILSTTLLTLSLSFSSLYFSNANIKGSVRGQLNSVPFPTKMLKQHQYTTFHPVLLLKKSNINCSKLQFHLGATFLHIPAYKAATIDYNILSMFSFSHFHRQILQYPSSDSKHILTHFSLKFHCLFAPPFSSSHFQNTCITYKNVGTQVSFNSDVTKLLLLPGILPKSQ